LIDIVFVNPRIADGMVILQCVTMGYYTVEPPNKGHFRSRAFVLFLEVVLWFKPMCNL